MKKRVITYGTFDLFHIGHLRMLQRARELGGKDGELIVAVSTDEFNWNSKQKKCAIPDKERMEIVAALRCVDRVIEESCWEQKRQDILEHRVDTFVIGEDWRGKFDDLKDICEVVYLPRTEGISSSDLKGCLVSGSVEYKQYSGSLVLSVKNEVRRLLKSSKLGKDVYPIFQRCWRAYAIPMRRRRLQRHGTTALARLHRLMQEHKVPYYCDYGTLLGFVRDQGFIKNDDDIDISIQPDKMAPAELLKLFIDAGYGFLHGFHYEGKIIEFSVLDSSGISIDVFFPITMGSGMIHGYQPIWDPARQYPCEKANTLIEYDFIEATGVKTINVLGVQALVPGNYDEVLTSEYGPWQVPDSKFNTVTDRKHREMPGFAFRLTQEEILAYERPALSE